MSASAVRPPVSRGTGMLSVTVIEPPASRAVPVASTQGTLALDFAGADGAGPRDRQHPSGRGDLREVSALRAELDTFATRFCAAVVEVIEGDRGPQQLLRRTSPAVYEALVKRSEALAQVTGGDQRLRRLRAQIRSVHLFCPTPRAAELSVHVRHGERSRAIAARLEHVEGRWLCVDLLFG